MYRLLKTVTFLLTLDDWYLSLQHKALGATLHWRYVEENCAIHFLFLLQILLWFARHFMIARSEMKTRSCSQGSILLCLSTNGILPSALLFTITEIILHSYRHSWVLMQSGGSYAIRMMTSSNGNIFRVTGSLCGEFTGHSVTKTAFVQEPILQMIYEILIEILWKFQVP